MLGNFTYCNPTKLYFGKDALDGLNAELPKYGVKTDSVDFGGEVVLKLAIKAVRFDEFSARISEMFAGRIKPEVTGERFDYR